MDLVNWIKENYAANTPPIHLTQWYFIKQNLTFLEWDVLRSRKLFSQYYDTALDMMALFTQQNDKLSAAYGNRFLGIYSKDLRAHEKQIAAEKREGEKEQQQTLVDLLKTEISQK